MKIACKNKLFVYCLIICSVISCVRADIDPIAEIRYFTAFQYADFAGEGTAVDHYGNTLVIDVNNYWFGNFPTNPVPITGVSLSYWVDNGSVDPTSYFKDKTIVFFAMTNEWKTSQRKKPRAGSIIWDADLTFTNTWGYCPPKFVWSYPPTWFALETNDVAHLHFFSNIVESVVVNRDRRLFYTTTRDAIMAGESGDPDERLYRMMSFWPLLEFIWDEEEEASLVEMINDPLLTRMLRARAMGQLKKRFDWSATNTIPEL
jgi:hypothetical protein